MSYLPCQNPNCRSEGKPHPNCHCYDHITGTDKAWAEGEGYQFPGTTKGLKLQGVRGGAAKAARARGRRVMYAAKGGEVSSVCELKMPHLPDCEHYAEGGPVSQFQPKVTKGHAAVKHGLLGLLTGAGKANLQDSEGHARTLNEARLHHGSDPIAKSEAKPNFATTLADHISSSDHESAAGHVHGHPLVGGASKANLPDIMQTLGPNLMANEPHPAGMRASVDYLETANRGASELASKMSSVLGAKKSERIHADMAGVEKLKQYLDMVEQNPEKLLDVGGDLGHYLPDHAAELGNMAAQSVAYFQSIKPKPTSMGPLEEPLPPTKTEEYAYTRQLEIAQQPLILLENVKDGTVLPQDIATVQACFPALYEKMQESAYESLLEAVDKKVEIPYRQKLSMSMLLGQPLDASLEPVSVQAIMQANGDQQAQNQAQAQKKANAVQMKQINKVDELYETPYEKRATARK